MDQMVFSFNQAFLLAALLPSLAVIFYLLINNFRHLESVALAMVYFFSLSCSFALPILKPFEDIAFYRIVIWILTFIFNCLPELSFLLIIQFIKGKLPDWRYFLILTVPLIGGGSFTYLYLKYNSLCLNEGCFSSYYFMIIYRVVSAALVFLLLVLTMRRNIDEGKLNRDRHKYWLIISLIIFNLLNLALNLAEIWTHEYEENLFFARTMVGVGFVYLVLSSVFRVFNDSFQIEKIRIWEPNLKEDNLGLRVEELLLKEKIYLKPGITRRDLAGMLGTNETILSKIINGKYKMPFRDIINDYRINDARNQLLNSDKPISHIAEDSGFNSLSSFNRVFKEITGMSPTEFKASNKKS